MSTNGILKVSRQRQPLNGINEIGDIYIYIMLGNSILKVSRKRDL